MKNLSFIFVLISVVAFGQKKSIKRNADPASKINCYLPSGEKCPSDKTGINMFETNKFFEPKRRTWFTWYIRLL